MKFSEMISCSKSLKSLKLVKNKTTDEGAEWLIKGLAYNTSLRSLNLT
jgi:Ran GTPase-activating protein (RanGAP) involved in mRNA processing and transport